MSASDYDSDDNDVVGIDEDWDAQVAGKSPKAGKSSLQTGKSLLNKKRQNHNLNERKRRDNIKDCFAQLRESVPLINPEKVASRAHILRCTIKYIQDTRLSIIHYKQDTENIQKENARLEAAIEELESVQRRKLNE